MFRDVERLLENVDFFVMPTVAAPPPPPPVGWQVGAPLVADGVDHGPLRQSWYP